jgi:hypothetical protein
LHYGLSLFFFSPRVQFLGFFMQPRPTGVSRAGLNFCSTFVSRQKWKKPPQKATSNWNKSENLKYILKKRPRWHPKNVSLAANARWYYV